MSPRPGELVRLEHRGAGGAPDALVAATAVRLAGSPKPVSTSLPFAAGAAAAVRRDFPGAHQVVEGRARVMVDHGPVAYQYGFAGPDRRRPGSVVVAKVLVVPERGDHPRRAVALELGESSRDRKVVGAVREQPSGLLLSYPVRDREQVRVAAQTSGRIERPVETFALR